MPQSVVAMATWAPDNNTPLLSALPDFQYGDWGNSLFHPITDYA
jgi:hypothetical protein